MKTKKWVMFDVTAGGRTTPEVSEFKVAVPEGDMELRDAMKLVFEKFGAKTTDDLPKPFDMTRSDVEVLVAVKGK